MHLVLLLFALFASLFGLSKATLAHAEPFFIIGARMFCAGLVLTGFAWLRQGRTLGIRRQDMWAFVGLALTMVYLTNIAEIWGLTQMDSARACLIYSLSPFVTALVCYVGFREVLGPRKWLGLTIGFVGLGPLIIEDVVEFQGALRWGELALVVAVVASVIGWVSLGRLVGKRGYSPVLANGVAMTLGGTMALAHSYLFGGTWQPVPVIHLLPFLQYALAVTLISNLICYNLYGYLLRRYSATFMAFAGLVTPLFASLFGWLFLDEAVSVYFFVSLALFMVGLTLFHQEEIREGKLRPLAAPVEASS